MRKWSKTTAFWLLMLCGMGSIRAASGQTVHFSGYDWTVKSGDKIGPGPNRWSADNAWVDTNGWLHLKISQKDGNWYCGEVGMTQSLGFGTYQFLVVGRIDQFDKNIVLGLFNYPPPNIGPDGTNEIDIEFSHWGNDTYPPGNYTVWPAKTGVMQSDKTFTFTLNGDYTTQRFRWRSQSILFQSLHGHRDDDQNEFGRWLFAPPDFRDRIPQQPLPVLLNLWLFNGHAPTDGKAVEIVIKQFTFTPWVKLEDAVRILAGG